MPCRKQLEKINGAMPPVRPLASQCRGTARKGEAQLLNLRLTKKGNLTPTRRLRRPDVRHGYAVPEATGKNKWGYAPGAAFGLAMQGHSPQGRSPASQFKTHQER